MADSKKYNGSTWQHSLRKLGTSTDTITTLPVDVYADGNNATVGLKGNTVQNGTPTPDNPIMPEGTGERMGNLLPSAAEQTLTSGGITIRCDGNGRYHVYGTTSNATITIYFDIPSFVIPVSVDKGGNGTFSIFNTYTGKISTGLLLYNGSTLVDAWGLNSLNKRSTSYSAMGGKTITKLAIATSGNQTIDGYISPMFTNNGVLPSEFEPYGYKIPISSANTTTPVYLGEVQTTRAIRKYVFVGTENWARTSNGEYYLPSSANPINNYKFIDADISINSHFPSQGVTSSSSRVENGKSAFFYTQSSGTREYYIAARDIPTLEDFKSYLAAQYANGTPVTVWYVLSSATTAIVNEPLMKIGDYADTVSGITVPTITGKDTFDVETTLKPSEASLSYTGWHDATVEEWDGSQWNE